MEAEIGKIITTLAIYYGINLSKEQITLFVDDLKMYSVEQLQQACLIYRKNSKNEFFPRPAKLIVIMESMDGRPSVEEAWSIVPKDDSQAAYMNDEMMAAWTAADNLLSSDGDMVSARMVFKEVYEKKIAEARLHKIKPRWWLSRASGKNSERINEAALMDAVTRGSLPESEARILLPNLTFGKQEPTNLEMLENKAEVRRLIESTTKVID